jgi:hypothetical protein
MYWGRKLHISPKYRPAQDQCQNASVGNQWWDDHDLHKFGKTPEDTQHPTTQQQTCKSPINIYTKKGSLKLCSLMNTLTSFKLIKFWQKGLVQKSNMNSVVRLWQQCWLYLWLECYYLVLVTLPFSMPSFSTNSTCLPKIPHGSCHKQAQVSYEAPGKMQLTVLPYRLSNYMSFSRPRIPTKMTVDELVNEAREGEQSTLPFISASSQSCLRLWVFLPPTQHREDNHLRDKIRWKTTRCPPATHPKPRPL